MDDGLSEGKATSPTIQDTPPDLSANMQFAIRMLCVLHRHVHGKVTSAVIRTVPHAVYLQKTAQTHSPVSRYKTQS